jgi:putative membrane protein
VTALAPAREIRRVHRMKVFLQRWVINTAGVLLASTMVSGIRYDKFTSLLAASLLLGVLNAILRPLLVLLSLPLVVFTLGLFLLVINALLLEFVGWLLQPHFQVAIFGAAFGGALIITIITLLLNSFTGTGDARVIYHRGPPPKRPDDDDHGPVIDV